MANHDGDAASPSRSASCSLAHVHSVESIRIKSVSLCCWDCIGQRARHSHLATAPTVAFRSSSSWALGSLTGSLGP